MSTQYGGKAANIVSSNAFAILSSTHTNPSVVTCGAPHGMLSDEEADISGHAVNTAINGVWPVTVISPTVFSVAVAANGAGGMTGQVQPMRLGATGAIPSDGDDEDVASVNVSLETLFDRTAALAAWTGGYKLAAIVTFGHTGSITIPAEITTPDTAWHVMPAGSGNPAALPWVVPGVVPGDLVEISLTGSLTSGSVGSASSTYSLSLGVSLVPPGGSPTYAKLASSAVTKSVPNNGTGPGAGVLYGGELFEPVHITTGVTVGAAGSLYVVPGMQADVASLDVILFGDLAVIIKVWRPTGQPQ